MQTYTLNYHKNSILIISMLFIPIIYSGLTLVILLKLQPLISYWLMLGITGILLLAMILLLKWLISSKIVLKSQIFIDDKGIHVKLNKQNFLYRHKDFYSSWENVMHISEIFCSLTGNYFYRITFKNPSLTTNFSALKNEEVEADKFFSNLNYLKDVHNFDSNSELTDLPTWA